MDLVGPLPKSAHAHEYIMRIVDHATCNLVALPLQRATSQPFTWELMMLFSRLRIPKDLLTDQCMFFLSKIMVDLCQLL